MKRLSEQQLWVAAHLLYPNSSQAVDVYQTILNSITFKDNEADGKIIFEKLENFFSKTPTVRSAQPFRVFEENPVEQWNALYKKSSPKHLLIIIGLVIFKLPLTQICKVVKVTEEKARFLAHQAFKKVTEFSLRNPAVDLSFKFKKANDLKVSYFFTHENLVGYCLNILAPKDKTLVEVGLQEYAQLQILQKKYSDIIQELEQLVNISAKSNLVFEVSEKSRPYQGQTKKTFSELVRVNKGIAAMGLFTVLFFVATIFRPVTLNKLLSKSGPSTIKLSEVTTQPTGIDQKVDVQVAIKAVNLKEMPVESNAKKNPVVEISKSEQPAIVKNELAVLEKKQATKSKSGGLYRGAIIVSDLDTVSSRITEKFVALGGKKAGEVELGWRKSPHVSYYHITLPEGSVQDAKDFLKNFGQLQLDFESHPRLMPAGIKRMILEVREVE